MFCGTQDKCAVCKKTVYPLEKVGFTFPLTLLHPILLANGNKNVNIEESYRNHNSKARANSTNLGVLGESFKRDLLLYLIINSYIFLIKIYFSCFLRGRITN